MYIVILEFNDWDGDPEISYCNNMDEVKDTIRQSIGNDGYHDPDGVTICTPIGEDKIDSELQGLIHSIEGGII